MPAWIRITERVPNRTSAPSLCPGPRGPRAPGAEGDCLSTWGLEGRHGRALGQNSDVHWAPGGHMAPVPPSRVAATHPSDSGDVLLVFGATVTAMPHPRTRWMAPTPQQRDQGFLQGTRAKGPGGTVMVTRKSSVPALHQAGLLSLGLFPHLGNGAERIPPPSQAHVSHDSWREQLAR